jgi:hypothetical protein
MRGDMRVLRQARIGLNERARRLPGRFGGLAAGLGAAVIMMTGALVAQTPDSTATPATPGSVASPAASAYVSTNVELGEIEWAREIDPATNAPVRRATGFVTTDDAIHAVIPVIRIMEGAVVSATWSFDGEPVPALDASVTATGSYENGWIAFTLTRPVNDIWPTGIYGITITVDGAEALSAEVLVQVPPA